MVDKKHSNVIILLYYIWQKECLIKKKLRNPKKQIKKSNGIKNTLI